MRGETSSRNWNSPVTYNTALCQCLSSSCVKPAHITALNIVRRCRQHIFKYLGLLVNSIWYNTLCLFFFPLGMDGNTRGSSHFYTLCILVYSVLLHVCTILRNVSIGKKLLKEKGGLLSALLVSVPDLLYSHLMGEGLRWEEARLYKVRYAKEGHVWTDSQWLTMSAKSFPWGKHCSVWNWSNKLQVVRGSNKAWYLTCHFTRFKYILVWVLQSDVPEIKENQLKPVDTCWHLCAIKVNNKLLSCDSNSRGKRGIRFVKIAKQK